MKLIARFELVGRVLGENSKLSVQIGLKLGDLATFREEITIPRWDNLRI